MKKPFYLYFIYPFFVWLLISLVLIAMYPKGHILLWVNDHHHPWLDQVFKYLTLLGDGWIFAPFTIYFAWVNRSFLWALAVTGISQILLVQGLKRYVFSSWVRPPKYFGPEVELHFVEGVKILSNHTFPSGHSTTAFGVAALLAYHFKHPAASALCFALALLTAFSRMYLNIHFLWTSPRVLLWVSSPQCLACGPMR